MGSNAANKPKASQYLTSGKFKNIMIFIESDDYSHTIDTIVSGVTKSTRLQNPRKDVIRTLYILRKLGLVESEYDRESGIRIFKSAPFDRNNFPLDLSVMVEISEKIFNEMEASSSGSAMIENLRKSLPDADNNALEKTIEFLVSKKVIARDPSGLKVKRI